MKVLIIGGRSFLGRHIVNSLLNVDANVSLFNRGKTNNDLFTESVHIIQGDRFLDFTKLKESWDVVIDTCGYIPRNVAEISSHLTNFCQHYVFISSCSVYEFVSKPTPLDEGSKIVSLEVDPQTDSPESYGARKYLCEQEVKRHFQGKVTIIRPGLIVGPYDTTFRFPYWINRVSEGGNVLAPGDAGDQIQWIDGRDLADWIVKLVTNGTKGIFNATGPKTPFTMGEFLEICQRKLNKNTKFVWASEEFLREKKIVCWSYIPMWVYKELRSIFLMDSTKAIESGLTFRPLEDTVLSTKEWLQQIKDIESFKSSTLPKEVELKLLSELHDRTLVN